MSLLRKNNSLPLVTTVLSLALFAGWPAAQAGASTCQGAERPAQVTGETAWRSSVVCLVNQERARYHRRPLRIVSSLQNGAQRYSAWMVQHHAFNHNNLEARFRSSGYTRGMSNWGMGENILWSGLADTTPQDAVRLWLASPHHRSNLLSPAWRDTGVGITRDSPEAHHGWTVVQWFGERSR